MWRRYMELEMKTADVAFTGLAGLDERAGRTAEALEWRRLCVERFPDSAAYRLAYARLLLERRDAASLQAAVDQLEQALRQEASLPEAWFRLGLACEALARPEEAVEAMRHAIDLEPALGRRYAPLARMLQATGRPQQARAALARYARYQRYSEEVDRLRAECRRAGAGAAPWLRLASLAEKERDLPAAVEAYLAVLRLDPRNTTARAALAVARRRLGWDLESPPDLAPRFAPPEEPSLLRPPSAGAGPRRERQQKHAVLPRLHRVRLAGRQGEQRAGGERNHFPAAAELDAAGEHLHRDPAGRVVLRQAAAAPQRLQHYP
jgi:tetratricopeptide (TPR) repeat protein